MVANMEEFRDIIGYEGYYQISDLGRVKSLERWITYSSGILVRVKEKILKFGTNGRGYYTVNLYKEGSYKTRTVHQLVAEAFLGHKPCGYKVVIDHIDNNRLNNQKTNLQLLSNRENSSKNTIRVTSNYTGVGWHKGNKKWYSAIRIQGKRKYLGYFKTQEEASEAYKNALKHYCYEIRNS